MSTTNALTFPVMSKAKSSEVLRREFGFWLQKKREARGLSQKYVAEKAGFTVTQLSRIENGQSGTKRNKVILLANIIGIGEIEALKRFAPESVTVLPEGLENIPFDELDEQDFKEIGEFINFKLFQKRKAQKGEEFIADKTAETEEIQFEMKNMTRKRAYDKTPAGIQLEMPAEENLHGVTTYRFENGQLIPDAAFEEDSQTVKKPFDK